jgi:6-phosphofructo-2-kinase/fructose-2,6-biphosphatase
MEDMLSWMEEGGQVGNFLVCFFLIIFWQLIISAALQVGICDATNSTRNRRNMLMKMAEGKCKVQLNQQ